jgi:hypothetical protein
MFPFGVFPMPFVQSKNLVILPDVADDLLATLSAVPGAALFDAPEIILFTNAIQFTTETELADLTLATFTGYAPDALGTLLGPGLLANGNRFLHAQVDFVGGAIVAPGETVYGYAITNGAGNVLYAGETFETPVPFINPGDYLSLDVVLAMPSIWETGL